jgi:type II secretory pathway pseudopilin PulG
MNYPEQMDGISEGFDIFSTYGHNELDLQTRYIISVNELLKRQSGQTDLVFLTGQLINIIKMFNSNLEAYFQKVYETKDYLDPNISIDLINSVVSQLFEYIKKVVNGAPNKDNTLSNKVRTAIIDYFYKGFTVLNTKLTALNVKPIVGSSNLSLYTNEQITDPDDLSKPSIMHFLIVCNSGSSLVNQIQNGQWGSNRLHMDFFISNRSHGSINGNFLLSVNGSTANLQTTAKTYMDYAESFKYNTKSSGGGGDLTMQDLGNVLLENNVDVYKIAQSETGGPFLVIIVLGILLLLAIGWYFSDFGDTGTSAEGSSTNMMRNAASSVNSALIMMGNAASSKESAMDMMRNAASGAKGAAASAWSQTGELSKTYVNKGNGLYMFHGLLCIILFFIFIRLHNGDGLKGIKDALNKTVKDSPDAIMKANAELKTAMQ